MSADPDDLAARVRDFEESENVTRDGRLKAERDRDYFDHIQLSAAELAELKRRGQPPLVINRIHRKINYLRGMEMRGRSDPKAYARTPRHEKDADSVTDALRFVADENHFNSTASQVYGNELIEGYGGVEIGVDTSENPPRVTITHLPWDRIFYDPHSVRAGFSDAKYLGIVVWMDVPDAKAMYPGREEAIESTFSGLSTSDTYDDRPRFATWSDNRRTRVRVCQMAYRRGGGWWTCTFTRGGYLVDPAPSVYVDEKGRTLCPYELQSAYVDRENNRYGAVRELIDLQDEINKRRSKALHLLSVRQVIGEKGAVDDVAQARRELAKPDGYIEIAPGMRFEVAATSDFTAGQMQLLQHATAEMDLAGPNAAMAGKEQRDQSGRAIIAQQQGGAIEVEPLLDGHRDWKRRVFTAVWHRIRQYWTDEVWVRVTDDEDNLRWSGINRKVTLADKLGEMPPEMQAAYMRRMGLVPGDPRLAQQVGVENEIAGLDVDVVIEEGPDVASLQGEEFAQIAEMAKAGVPIPPDAIIKASSLRNKDSILKSMGGGEPSSPEQQQQMAAQAQGMQQAAAQADIRLKQAQADKAEAEAMRAKAEAAIAVAQAQGGGQPQAAPVDTGGEDRAHALKLYEIDSRNQLEREKIAALDAREERKARSDMRREAMDTAVRDDLDVVSSGISGKTERIVNGAMESVGQAIERGLTAQAEATARMADAMARSGAEQRAGFEALAGVMGAEQEIIVDPATGRPVGSRRRLVGAG